CGNKLRYSLGERWLFWAVDGPTRSVGPGHRSTSTCAHDGFIRTLGSPSHGPFHVRVQHEARGPLPEVWVLAPLSPCTHGTSCAPGTSGEPQTRPVDCFQRIVSRSEKIAAPELRGTHIFHLRRA